VASDNTHLWQAHRLLRHTKPWFLEAGPVLALDCWLEVRESPACYMDPPRCGKLLH